MPSAALNLSIIMCTYNEIARIERALLEVTKFIETRPEKVEILVIDNCSTDGTKEFLAKYSHPKVRVLFNPQNLGKGGSIRKGISESQGEYFVIFDPDLEYTILDAFSCYDAIIKNGVEGVLGSRLIGKRIKYHYLANYVGVVFLTSIINSLFGSRLTDSATATKLFKTSFVKNIAFRCTGFDFDFELVTRVLKCGGSIIEIPAGYEPRTVAEGKKIKAVRDGMASLKIILEDWMIPKRTMLLCPAQTELKGCNESRI